MEFVDGEGKCSEVVWLKVLVFVGINMGFDLGLWWKVLCEMWFLFIFEGFIK